MAVMASNGAVLNLRITEITVADTRRPIGDITDLAESIREVGLLNPITVNEDGTLIAGGHRLAACRALGWEFIPANSVTMDELHAELAEIDENLVTNPPTALERGEQLRRRKALYEAIHPEAKPEAVRSAARWGKKDESPTADSAVGEPEPEVAHFTADAAAKTGRSERAVREDIQIAESITPEVKAMIQGTPVADRKTDLLAIARTPPTGQAFAANHYLTQLQAKKEPAAALPSTAGELAAMHREMTQEPADEKRYRALIATIEKVMRDHPPDAFADDEPQWWTKSLGDTLKALDEWTGKARKAVGRQTLRAVK